jgi:hypothetical protein
MASSVGVKIEVDDHLFIAKIADIEAASLEAARLFVTQGGLMLEADVKDRGFNPRPAGSQRVSKSGRTYYVGPATPPKPTQRTGNLRNSFVYRNTQRTATGYKSETGTYIKYAPYVDYGTSRSRKFPFAEDGVARILPRLNTLAQELFRKAQDA